MECQVVAHPDIPRNGHGARQWWREARRVAGRKGGHSASTFDLSMSGRQASVCPDARRVVLTPGPVSAGTPAYGASLLVSQAASASVPAATTCTNMGSGVDPVSTPARSIGAFHARGVCWRLICTSAQRWRPADNILSPPDGGAFNTWKQRGGATAINKEVWGQPPAQGCR